MTEATIYILTPVHNRRETTARFIDNLKRQTLQTYHLVLIDDGSTDGTAEMARNMLGDKVTILKGHGNLWWAGSLQKAYLWARRNLKNPVTTILIINDDTDFSESYLASAQEALAPTSGKILFSRCYGSNSKQLTDSGVAWDWPSYRLRLAQSDSEINCASTRGIFLKLHDFFNIGGFHPIILPHYLSDYEYTMRAHQMGYQIITNPYVTLQTDEAPSGINKLNYQSLRKFIRGYFSYRNQSHPIHVFFFILLACPSWKLKFKHWVNLFGEVLIHFYHVLKKYPGVKSVARVGWQIYRIIHPKHRPRAAREIYHKYKKYPGVPFIAAHLVSLYRILKKMLSVGPTNP